MAARRACTAHAAAACAAAVLLATACHLAPPPYARTGSGLGVIEGVHSISAIFNLQAWPCHVAAHVSVLVLQGSWQLRQRWRLAWPLQGRTHCSWDCSATGCGSCCLVGVAYPSPGLENRVSEPMFACKTVQTLAQDL